eukprot:symbB.v1.2.036756.t1/scaffold5224.1/size29657/3
MSYPTDLFSFSPTDCSGDDAGTDPAATAPGPASDEGAHCPAPPQATVSPPSIDDLWHKAFENYGLKRPTEVTEIHVFRVILQSSRDKDACTRSVTKTGPMSDPVQTLEQIIEERWDLEIEEHDRIRLDKCSFMAPVGVEHFFEPHAKLWAFPPAMFQRIPILNRTDLANGLYNIDLTRYSSVTSEDAAGVQLLDGQEKLQELVHLPRTWPLARLTIPLAGLRRQIDRLLEGYCFQILATNRDPEAHNGRVIQTATHLTWILAEYLADTIAWLMRSILDHASKILFDNDTQPLLTPNFWILPLYRELLNSARRIRPSASSERARGCTGLVKEVSEQVFSKERRRLQAKHLWMEVKLRWRVLADRMYTKAPTGKSKEELDALLFDRAARRNHTNPYEEKSYRGAAIKEVQAWWKQCKDWMAHFKGQSEPFVFDFKNLLKALSGKEAEAQSEVDAFMENCAKRWQTREGTYQLKRRRLKPDVRDPPEDLSADVDMADI